MLGATSLSSPPHERPGSTAIVSISIPNAIGDDAATIVGKARELCRPIVGEHFLTNLQRLVWRLAHMAAAASNVARRFVHRSNAYGLLPRLADRLPQATCIREATRLAAPS